MKSISCYLLAGVLSATIAANAQVNIIPKPVKVTVPKVAGQFTITANTPIVLEGSGLENSVNFLNDYLQELYGFHLKTTKKETTGNAIVLNFERMDKPLPGAYTMGIKKGQIYIAGDNEEGVFYGIQSLIQLLPIEKSATLKVPFVNIEDYPRFAYRGMHLDVGRHFFPVSFVKRYIDYIALHKMNYFHWHLTEDQGWRIEIKKYPRLTEVGAWRNGTIIGRFPGKGNDSLHYGGFYTQDEIKDVVAYAAKRYITIIPEIEMPGHASAALASYPYLGCTGGPYQVQQTWGVFTDVYCAGNDSVFNFLQDVLDEVIPLFPSKYIHIGGDECPKDSWKVCPKCQKRIQDQHLKDEHELQSYFVQRIEKYINSKGKVMIGWDEILEGGLAPNAVVMSWRGEQGGIDAAKQNHDVIMTPGAYCYLDHSQSKNEDSVTIGGYLPLDKVYSYEPIPKELDAQQAKHVLGAQGNVWTEYMGNTAKVEYMIFPRLSALSEVLWSPKEKRDWNDFEKRLQVMFKRYDLWRANYSKEYFGIHAEILPGREKNGVSWRLDSKMTEINKYAKIVVKAGNLEIKTFTQGVPDWSKDPDGSKGIIKEITYIPVDETRSFNVFMRVISPDEQAGRPSTCCDIYQNFFINKATNKKLTLVTTPAETHPGSGGTFGLVNGAMSEKGINSDEWLGWQGPDMEATIDLGKTDTISKVNVHTLDQQRSWVYPPIYIEVFVSANNKDFTSIGKTSEVIPEHDYMANMTVSFPATRARYVKIVGKNYGKIPDGKPGSGNNAWLFADEIQID